MIATPVAVFEFFHLTGAHDSEIGYSPLERLDFRTTPHKKENPLERPLIGTTAREIDLFPRRIEASMQIGSLHLAACVLHSVIPHFIVFRPNSFYSYDSAAQDIFNIMTHTPIPGIVDEKNCEADIVTMRASSNDAAVTLPRKMAFALS